MRSGIAVHVTNATTSYCANFKQQMYLRSTQLAYVVFLIQLDGGGDLLGFAFKCCEISVLWRISNVVLGA